jgi:hypothetical protein
MFQYHVAKHAGFIIVFLVLFFAILYAHYEKFEFVHALYYSTLIQSTVGPPSYPTQTISKLLMALQAFCTIIITYILIVTN